MTVDSIAVSAGSVRDEYGSVGNPVSSYSCLHGTGFSFSPRILPKRISASSGKAESILSRDRSVIGFSISSPSNLLHRPRAGAEGRRVPLDRRHDAPEQSFGFSTPRPFGPGNRAAICEPPFRSRVYVALQIVARWLASQSREGPAFCRFSAP